jgi:nucleotide-binding universal stress UspA family protein
MKIPIKKVLAPTDFSESSEHALNYALTLASLAQAELQLLHVVEPIAYPLSGELFGPVLNEVELTMKMEATFRKELDERVASLKKEYPKLTGRQVTGNPFLEIVRAAREGGFDMIVMGTHGRTGLAHVLIGSVAEKVVREGPCPVLTIKHPEHQFNLKK